MSRHSPRPHDFGQQDTRPRRTPRQLDPDLFLNTDVDDVENSLPSPHTVLLESYPEQSPAYRSRSNLDLTDTDMPDDTQLDEKQQEQGTKAKHAVHYSDDVHPSNNLPSPPAVDKFEPELISSRASSIAGTDDDDDEDAYDWSGEEDLVDEEAKFEHAMGVKKKHRSLFVRLITLLFSTLIGSTFLSGLIITPALVVHFFWYKPHPDDHRKYVKDNVEAWLFWAAANVSISWGLGLIVDIVPVVVRWCISLAWGHVSEMIKNRLELYNSVKDTIKPVLYAASCWVSWVILFDNIYQLYDMDNTGNSRAPYTPRVYEAIEFLFFFALVICAQRMLSHFIAFSFHRTAYKERLDGVQEALRVIEKLRTYRPKRRHTAKSSFGRSTPVFSALLTPSHEKDQFISRSRPGTPGGSRPGTPELGAQDSDEDRDATLVQSKKKGKARTRWIPRHRNKSEPANFQSPRPDLQRRGSEKHRYPPSPLPQSPGNTSSPTSRSRRRSEETEEDAAAIVQQAAAQAAKALKSAVLHDARNIQGKDTDEVVGGLVWNVTSSHEAKRLARSIWMAFKEPGRKYLIPSDFIPAFGTLDEAKKAFAVFDKDNNGDLTRAELKTTLLKVYKERRFLSRSMRDVGEALKTLDHMLLFLALIILFFISLSVFGIDIAKSLTSLYTIGIGASFIFKNSASNAFDAIMFLFVTHPFDTGDRCFIDDENLVVKKMGLFATIFTRSDGTETYYFNSQLFNKFITNVRRSDKTAENLTLQLAWQTPLEKLDELQKCLCKWLQTEENRWFQPNTSVTLQNVVNQRYIEVTVGIPYNSNWQDWGLKLARKTAFCAAVNYYCRHLGIVTYNSPMPIAIADPDTGEMLMPDIDGYTAGGEEDVEPLESPVAPGEPGDRREREREKTTWLGFQPPEDNIRSGLRRRKRKSKKAILRTFGAEGA
ncbi:Mechanosensitive ion channel-domain-containing protein [Trametes punicea]|nr:Mechanosensitive ion channel-domain-containing protein [Trametes punicea]